MLAQRHAMAPCPRRRLNTGIGTGIDVSIARLLAPAREAVRQARAELRWTCVPHQDSLHGAPPSSFPALSQAAVGGLTSGAAVAGSSASATVADFKALLHAGAVHMRSGNLPSESTDILLHWFLDHIPNPYPSQAEKRALAEAAGRPRALTGKQSTGQGASSARSCTGLTETQVRNYFTNVRKRHWTPMAQSKAQLQAGVAPQPPPAPPAPITERRPARCELEEVIQHCLFLEDAKKRSRG